MLEATESGIGTELIQREVVKVLFDNVNEAIDEQQAKWIERDEEWNLLTGQEPTRTSLEHIEAENYHTGHRPSLVNQLPQPNYPNVSVMAYQARPASEIVDQASNFNVLLDIELMVKGDFEIEVDRRIQRTVEAVHKVLARHETLNKLSRGWDNDPVVIITDIFTRNEEAGGGKRWYWQAARLQYNLTRHNKLP